MELIGHISAAIFWEVRIGKQEKVSLCVIDDDAAISELETSHAHAQDNVAAGLSV